MNDLCGILGSTYSKNPKTGLRDGEPICDQFRIVHYKDRTILAAADGCGWGHNSRSAAYKYGVVELMFYFLDLVKRLFNIWKDSKRNLQTRFK